MKVFLIGMPGSGKSTLGILLANSLSLPFIDLDETIVSAEGKSIAKIFEDMGEDYFRNKERQTLHSVVANNNSFVMATGGGVPCFFDNITFINHHGISVYLDVPANTLADRLLNLGKSDRPLLNSISDQDFVEELSKKRSYRNAYYQQAKVIIKKKDIHVTDILEQLKKLND